MTELDRDTVYKRNFYDRIHIWFEYDDHDSTPDTWLLGFSGPGLTSEYPVKGEFVREFVRDWDMEARE